jgi:hypothetical protein
MNEFLVPNFVPEYLSSPTVSGFEDGYIEKDYADGVGVVIEVASGEVETRFPGGALHYEGPEDELPDFIEDGHEDIQRNN